jgi:hypothetical protein
MNIVIIGSYQGRVSDCNTSKAIKKVTRYLFEIRLFYFPSTILGLLSKRVRLCQKCQKALEIHALLSYIIDA